MKPKYLILKFSDEDREFYFENKVIVIEDKKLVENLRKPNIKNGDSLLVIKSLDNIHISDVIQIKINLVDTGCFLASFNKKEFDEGKRSKLIDEIGSLKNKRTPTKAVQTSKIVELIKVLNKYRPIYVTFENTGDIQINNFKLAQEELKFPLLVLTVPKKKFVIKFKKQSKSPVKPAKNGDKPVKKTKVKSFDPISLFEMDYLFIFLFSLLGSFATTAATFEVINKKGIAIFLSILALVFALVLAFAMQSAIYKKGVEKNPFLRYYLGIFVLLGIAGGVAGGYFISKSILKTDIADFDYKKMIIISSLISLFTLLSSIWSSMLVNLIVKRKYKKM